MAVNPIRGEAEIVVAGVTYKLAATMESLSQVSAAIGDPPLAEFYEKLIGTSLRISRIALASFVETATGEDGESLLGNNGRPLDRPGIARRLIADFSLGDINAAQQAFQTLLAALVRDAPPESGDDDKSKSRKNARTASA